MGPNSYEMGYMTEIFRVLFKIGEFATRAEDAFRGIRIIWGFFGEGSLLWISIGLVVLLLMVKVSSHCFFMARWISARRIGFFRLETLAHIAAAREGTNPGIVNDRSLHSDVKESCVLVELINLVRRGELKALRYDQFSGDMKPYTPEPEGEGIERMLADSAHVYVSKSELSKLQGDRSLFFVPSYS